MSVQVEIKPKLVTQTFQALLSNYPYHPVLWTLYSVCQHLRWYKPQLHQLVVIEDYYPCEDPWLGGILGSIRDVLAIDNTKEECWHAYASIRDRGNTILCEIPREWVERVIVNENHNFESHSIPAKMYWDKHYFHVGCGPCHDEKSLIISSLSLYVGLKQLSTMLENIHYSEPAHIMYALGHNEIDLQYCVVCDDVDKKGLHNVEKTYLTGHYLLKILSHILMCKICNSSLKLFFVCLPYSEHMMDTVCDIYNDFNLPCIRFIVDAEFDIMRENVYSAVLTGSNDDAEYHKVINIYLICKFK